MEVFANSLAKTATYDVLPTKPSRNHCCFRRVIWKSFTASEFQLRNYPKNTDLFSKLSMESLVRACWCV